MRRLECARLPPECERLENIKTAAVRALYDGPLLRDEFVGRKIAADEAQLKAEVARSN